MGEVEVKTLVGRVRLDIERLIEPGSRWMQDRGSYYVGERVSPNGVDRMTDNGGFHRFRVSDLGEIEIDVDDHQQEDTIIRLFLTSRTED